MSFSNGLRIIVWIYLLIIKGAIVCGQVAGPNAVVLINGQATLDCVAVNMATTQWLRTTDGSSNSLLIAYGCSVSGSNAAYYSTEKPGGNICRLIIENGTMQQAGVYSCFNGASVAFNSLVTVIDPAANVVVYNQSEIVEGDQLNISCSINYTGPSSPAPSLHPVPYFTTLPGHNFTSLTYYPSANVVTVVATVQVQKPTVPIFRCNTDFNITGNTAGYNATPPADNIAVGATTEIDVQYEPSTPIISHEINNFTASDRSVCTLTTLTCNSTANPPPNYTWKDVTSGKVIGIYGSIFEWAEDNRTYECTATNTIKSANKSSSASYTVGNSSARPCASVKSTDIRICSDDGSCDDGATPRSCSNASHIYLTCNVSNVDPRPTQFQWKDGSGHILINTSEYNATINGGYSVFVYNEINQQSKTPAVIYVTVTDCCENWKLAVSVIIPWIGVCLIATIIFIVCYASLATPFRAKMLNRFSWLEYMLPCVNSPKVEPQRGDESAESSAPIWKMLGFVILLIFVSVTCGILFFPILITIAYCCPTVGEDNDGQMMNRSPKKGKPIYFIPLFLLMWFGVVALMFPLTFVLVYFITCEQMTFRYVVTR